MKEADITTSFSPSSLRPFPLRLALVFSRLVIMLYIYLLLSILFVQLVHAYSVRRDPQVTPCILKCLTISLPAGCSDSTNISCLCNSPTFQTVLKTCIQQTCPEEQATFETFQTFQCSAYTTTNALHSTGGTFASGSETATQPTDTSAQLAQLTDSASPHSDGSTIRIAAIVVSWASCSSLRWPLLPDGGLKKEDTPPPARLNHVRDALCSRDEQARTYRGADAIAIPWTPEPALSTPLLPPPSVATDSKLPIAQMYSSQRFQEVSGGLGSSSSSLEPTSSGVTGSLVSEPVDERRNSRGFFRLSLGLGLPPRYEPRRISRQLY
ncbi:hypothetical protein PIIN_08499 [Serendipita indica DSM 11827]|uniref:CFEM domain-containing protein n=1 Tax=Serendipita indica (strain DSM 11827) TaxID=1109443 RepID=G4TTA4_SERID|nr:hypothetical protein PIIN_08499 [Serendipita indica DSM 11827]